MTVTLTRDDINQLRKADSIVFRFDTSEYGFSNIEGSIRVRNADGTTNWDAERQFTIPVNPTSVTNYGAGRVEGGCWIFTSARFVPELATVFSYLKAGDQLFPHYVTGNDGLVGKRKGVMIDTFDLQVHRPVARGTKVLTFAIDHQLVDTDDATCIIRNLKVGASR